MLLLPEGVERSGRWGSCWAWRGAVGGRSNVVGVGGRGAVGGGRVGRGEAMW